jgi:hypothetical protein
MHAFIELLNEFLRKRIIVLMTLAVIVLMMFVTVTRKIPKRTFNEGTGMT